jgi:hypothetical protein
VKHTHTGGVEVGEQLEQQAVHSFSFSIPDLNSPVTGHRFRLLSQPLTCNYFLRQNTRETYSRSYADHSHLQTTHSHPVSVQPPAQPTLDSFGRSCARGPAQPREPTTHIPKARLMGGGGLSLISCPRPPCLADVVLKPGR